MTHTVIFVNNGLGGPPLHVRLHENALWLLRTLATLQERGEGRDVAAGSDGSPLLSGFSNMPPGEIESCLNASLGLLRRCAWKCGDQVLLVSEEEADAIRRNREASGVQPHSEAFR